VSTPVGPYTPVVRAGDWLIVSGQVGLGPDGLAEGFAGQLRQALENLRTLVEANGAQLTQVVKTTVFLVSMEDYAELNEIYTAFFAAHAGDHRPARSAVAVAELPIGALVEIEAWVHTA
jgi:2-iminobutanoate/2-iminopropanoate deaminase